MYECLAIFLTTGDPSARAERPRKVFSDPMTEVYLMFYQAALQVFVNFNKFLQREDPLMPVLHGEMNAFMKKIVWKVCKFSCHETEPGQYHYHHL